MSTLMNWLPVLFVVVWGLMICAAARVALSTRTHTDPHGLLEISTNQTNGGRRPARSNARLSDGQRAGMGSAHEPASILRKSPLGAAELTKEPNGAPWPGVTASEPEGGTNTRASAAVQSASDSGIDVAVEAGGDASGVLRAEMPLKLPKEKLSEGRVAIDFPRYETAFIPQIRQTQRGGQVDERITPIQSFARPALLAEGHRG